MNWRDYAIQHEEVTIRLKMTLCRLSVQNDRYTEIEICYSVEKIICLKKTCGWVDKN